MRVEAPAQPIGGLGAGLLVKDEEAARDAKPQERRIEEWVASTLEGKPTKSATSVWDDMLGAGRSLRPTKAEERRAAKDGDWGRFRLAERHGVALLRLTDAMLLKDQLIQEFADDLLELVNAGYDRVVLNFQQVERLSIQVVMGLIEAHLRCGASRGGRLKVCGLREEVAEGLILAGLENEIEIAPDEAAALESPWPDRPEFRPLPMSILVSLRIFYGDETSTGAPSMQRETSPSPTTTTTTRAVLLVGSGKAAGRRVSIGERGLVVGRDADCKLRVGSGKVSRRHARFETRGGRIFVSDLGSTNGTIVDGRAVRSAEVELSPGASIAIGPLRLTLELVPDDSQHVDAEVGIEEWLRGDEADAATTSADVPVTSWNREEAEPHRPLDVQLIQGVLVLTPLHAQLDDESRIGPLRSELQALGSKAVTRRVIVDLSHVAHVSSAAIGVLVAYALKLEREGGELRVSQVCPKVMAVLNQIRLPMLIEIHPTTDEAVLCAWRKPATSAVG